MSQNIQVNMQFTADTAQAQSQIQALQNSLNKLGSGSFLTSNSGLKTLASDLSSASTAATQLSVHLKNAFDVDTGKLDLARFNTSLKQSGNTLQSYGTSLSKIGTQGTAAFGQLTRTIANTTTSMTAMGAKVTKVAKTLTSAFEWTLSYGAVRKIISGFQSAINYAQDLNRSLNDIRIVTSQSTDQMAKFAEQANKAAKQLSTTTTAYTNASLIYYQQGLDDKSVKERTDVTVKMANATGESAEKISQQLTAVWNNFDKGGQRLEYMADVMTALGAATASSTDEISAGLEKFAAVAETAGLSYEYAASALATITATTRQSADSVGNGLRTLLSRLESLNLGETLDDGVTLTKYTKALDAIGVQVLDMNGGLKNADDILDQMAEKWKGLSQAQKMATAETVGGVRQYATIAALMENWDFMQENLQVAYGAEGTLEQQAEIYAESWEAAQKRVKAAAQAIYSDLIDDKAFITITDGFGELLNIIDQIIDSAGGLKGVIAGILALVNKLAGASIANGLRNFSASFMGLTKGGKEKLDAQKTANVNNAVAMLRQRGAVGNSYADNIVANQRVAALIASRKAPLTPDQQAIVDAMQSSINSEHDQLVQDEYDFKRRRDAAIKNWNQQHPIDNHTDLIARNAERRRYLQERFGEDDFNLQRRRDELEERQRRFENSVDPTHAGEEGNLPEVHDWANGVVEASQAITELIFGISSLIAGGQQLAGILDGSLEPSFANISSVVMSAAMGLPMVINGIKGLSAAITALSASNPILLAVMAAIAAVVASVAIIDAVTESSGERAQRLANETDMAKQAAEEAQQAYKNLINDFSSHNSLLDTLNSLTAGTVEFRAALLEANAAAEELISKYNLSSQDYYTDGFGAIRFTDEAKNRLEEYKLQEIQDSQDRYAVAKFAEINNKAFSAQSILAEQFDYIKDIIDVEANGNVDDYIKNGAAPGVQKFFDDLEAQTGKSGVDIYKSYAKNKDLGLGDITGATSQYSSILSGFANKDGEISDAESLAIGAMIANYDPAHMAEIEEQARYANINGKQKKVDGFGRNKKNLEQTYKDIFGEDAYEQLISDAGYQGLTNTQKKEKIANKIKEYNQTQALLDEFNNTNMDAAIAAADEFKNFRQAHGKDLDDLIAEGLKAEDSSAINIAAQGALQIKSQTAAELQAALIQNTNTSGATTENILGFIQSQELSIDDQSRIATIANNFGKLFGKGAGTAAVGNLLNGISSGINDDLANVLEKIDLSSDLSALFDIRNKSKLISDSNLSNSLNEIYTNAIKDLGGESGLLEKLYNSEEFSNSLEDLQETFKETGKLSAADILEAADSCEVLNDYLNNGERSAGALADAIGMIADGSMGINELSDALLAGMSSANALEDSLAQTYHFIDSFEMPRSITDIGELYVGFADQIESSLNAGMVADAPLMESWRQLFGQESLDKYMDAQVGYHAQQEDGSYLTPEQISAKFNEDFAAEIAAIKSIQQNGNLSGLWDYYGQQSETLAAISKFDKSDRAVQTDYDAALEAGYDISTQQGYIDMLTSLTDMGEDLARAMANELAATDATTREMWERNDAINGANDYLDEIGKVGYENQKNLEAFYNKYKTYLKDEYATIQDFIAKAKEKGTIFNIDKDFWGKGKATYAGLNEQLGGDANTNAVDATLDKMGAEDKLTQGLNKNGQTINRISRDLDSTIKAYEAMGASGVEALQMCTESGDTFNATITDAFDNTQTLIQETGETVEDFQKRCEQSVAKSNLQQQAETFAQAFKDIFLGTDGSTDVSFNVKQEGAEQAQADIEKVANKPYEATITANALDNASTTIQNIIDTYDNTQITLTVTAAGGGKAATGGIVGAYASGSANRKLKPGITLTGEEGKEIVWNKEKNYAYITGAKHPEFRILQPGDRVFNAQETKQILGGAASGGTAGLSSIAAAASGAISDLGSVNAAAQQVWTWFHKWAQEVGETQNNLSNISSILNALIGKARSAAMALMIAGGGSTELMRKFGLTGSDIADYLGDPSLANATEEQINSLLSEVSGGIELKLKPEIDWTTFEDGVNDAGMLAGAISAIISALSELQEAVSAMDFNGLDAFNELASAWFGINGFKDKGPLYDKDKSNKEDRQDKGFTEDKALADIQNSISQVVTDFFTSIFDLVEKSKDETSKESDESSSPTESQPTQQQTTATQPTETAQTVETTTTVDVEPSESSEALQAEFTGLSGDLTVDAKGVPDAGAIETQYTGLSGSLTVTVEYDDPGFTPKNNYIGKNNFLPGFASGKGIAQMRHSMALSNNGTGANNGYTGIAQVGELGPELMVTNHGIALAGVHGPTYTWVNASDRIYTHEQTRKILQHNNLGPIPGFHAGQNNYIPGFNGGTGYGSITLSDSGKGGNGGGNGGGENGLFFWEDEWERYHYLNQIIEDLQNSYDELDEAKERAFGKDKLKYIQQETENLEAQAELIKLKQQEQQDYYAEWKQWAIDAWGDQIVFDENGLVANFDDLQKQYLDKKGALETAGEKDKTAQDRLEHQWKLLQTYEEILNEGEEFARDYQDIMNQIIDAQIEAVDTGIELKINVDDAELKHLEYLFDKIQGDGRQSILALGYTEQMINKNAEKIDSYLSGIKELLGNEDFERFMNGNYEGIADEKLNKIFDDYESELFDCIEALEAFDDQLVEIADSAFSTFNNELENQISLLDIYNSTLETFKDLSGEVGANTLGLTNTALKQMSRLAVENAKSQLQARKAAAELAQQKVDEYKKLYEQETDELLKSKWKDALEQATQDLANANDAVASQMQATYEAMLADFQYSVSLATAEAEAMVAKIYGTMEKSQEAYDRAKDIRDLYLEDYEKYYELSKLEREIQSSINDTDNLKGKKELKNMLKEINDLREEGIQLSEYDIDYLTKKYELELARQQLEEAKDAKSMVKLARDANGNWGYVYTANEDNVKDAEQNYEDKLYEMQKANADYIDSLSEQIQDVYAEAMKAINELDPFSAGYEAEKESIMDAAYKKIAYFEEQMGKVVENQASTYDRAISTYKLANMGLVDSFDETILSAQYGAQAIGDYVKTLLDSIKIVEDALKEAETNKELDVNSIADGTVADMIGKITEQSEEAGKAITQTIDDVNEGLAGIQEQIEKTLDYLREQMTDRVKQALDLIEAINKAARAASFIDTDSQVTGGTVDIAGAATGGYTGEWGSFGKLAFLHEKELILNKFDTKNLLAAMDVLKTISLNANIMSMGIGALDASTIPSTNSNLEQSVSITAEFPNAVNHTEIEEAFNDLINASTQYANRKNKLY